MNVHFLFPREASVSTNKTLQFQLRLLEMSNLRSRVGGHNAIQVSIDNVYYICSVSNRERSDIVLCNVSVVQMSMFVTIILTIQAYESDKTDQFPTRDAY